MYRRTYICSDYKQDTVAFAVGFQPLRSIYEGKTFLKYPTIIPSYNPCVSKRFQPITKERIRRGSRGGG